MSSSSKSVIPSPPGHRWREFRIQILPGLTFAVGLIAVILLWTQYVAPVSMVGRVEALRTDVASPKTGSLAQLHVARFQKVYTGQNVAYIVTTDPQVLSATLALIQAEVDMIRAEMGTSSQIERTAINYGQLQLDWMKERVDLATKRVNLQLAEAEFERTENLYHDKLVSGSEYDIAKNRVAALRTEVQEQENLVSALTQSVERLSSITSTNTGINKHVLASIAVQEKKLKLAEAELGPITLKSPIDGVVSMIHRRYGEVVSAGDPIMTITASDAEHIVAYLRQPLYIQPTTNMMVRIQTRGLTREAAVDRIVAIGGQLLPINDALLPPMKNPNQELGLPVLVHLPEQLRNKVHPGEFVDVTILAQ